ncbi:MAG: hypothetical protein IJ797_00985 [Selenomonadaceae bacterium]|nr:hypothetical protein [Selenomonadaceae bacterium]
MKIQNKLSALLLLTFLASIIIIFSVERTVSAETAFNLTPEQLRNNFNGWMYRTLAEVYAKKNDTSALNSAISVLSMGKFIEKKEDNVHCFAYKFEHIPRELTFMGFTNVNTNKVTKALVMYEVDEEFLSLAITVWYATINSISPEANSKEIIHVLISNVKESPDKKADLTLGDVKYSLSAKGRVFLLVVSPNES